MDNFSFLNRLLDLHHRSAQISQQPLERERFHHETLTQDSKLSTWLDFTEVDWRLFLSGDSNHFSVSSYDNRIAAEREKEREDTLPHLSLEDLSLH